jgi:hypothetical protein
MNLKEIQMHLNKYTSYMEEIKRRTNAAKRVIDLRRSGSSLTGDAESDIDFVYLQLRKITELVMFACLVARKTAGDRLNKILRKGYELAKLKKELKSLNAEYFPKPKYDKDMDDSTVRSVGNLSEIGISSASDEDLLKAYGRAGNYLHAQRDSKYGDEKTKAKILDKAVEDLNNIVNLLNHHWIKVNDDVSFAVVMHGESDGEVQVSYLEKIKE